MQNHIVLSMAPWWLPRVQAVGARQLGGGAEQGEVFFTTTLLMVET